MLLPRYLKPRARWGWSLSKRVALLRQPLFVHRDCSPGWTNRFTRPRAASPGRRGNYYSPEWRSDGDSSMISGSSGILVAKERGSARRSGNRWR